MLKKWEDLPSAFQADCIRPYYGALADKKKQLYAKRLFDVFCSLLLLLLLFPVGVIVGILIRLDSKGPVFFRQTRVTQYGKEFSIYKFRTMQQCSGKTTDRQITVVDDPRVTRMGRIMRNSRLDEIPQLINILKGEMTFVGTRPEVPRYVARYSNEMMATLLLPAGITSKASIAFKDENEMIHNPSMAETIYVESILPLKMKYNLEYLLEFSMIGDIVILAQTIFRSVFLIMNTPNTSQMIQIRDETDITRIDQIVALHMSSFNGFFLTFLGRGFLYHMYKGYLEHPESGIHCAYLDGNLLGFLAYSQNMSAFYKHLLKKHFFVFTWYGFLGFLRKPTCAFRLLRALAMPNKAKSGEPYMELSSLAVALEENNKGVGTQLLDKLKESTDFSRLSYIKLETDRDDNEGANRFYCKNQFKLHHSYKTAEGRWMNEYRYAPNK